MPETSFEEDVRNMRYWQRRFFQARPGTQEKREAFTESRYYERLVDDHLKRSESASQVVTASGLFSEE